MVDEVIAHVGLYRRMVGARARGQMQYRFAFAMLLLGNLMATIADFVGVLALFGRIPNVVGWSLGVRHYQSTGT